MMTGPESVDLNNFTAKKTAMSGILKEHRYNGRVTDPARRRVWPDETWQIIDADRRGVDPCRRGVAVTSLISVHRYVQYVQRPL